MNEWRLIEWQTDNVLVALIAETDPARRADIATQAAGNQTLAACVIMCLLEEISPTIDPQAHSNDR
jgi:hypothetical protein